MPRSAGVCGSSGEGYMPLPVAHESFKGGRAQEVAVLMKMLRGQMPDLQPEMRLWLSVIERALKDAFLHRTRNTDSLRLEASRWLQSEDFEAVLSAIGLHPGWVRAKLQRIERREEG